MTVMGTPAVTAPVALETPERYTQIMAVWQADCLVCGLSPFDADTLVLLGYPVDEFDDGYDGQERADDGGAEILSGDGVGMDVGVGAVVFGAQEATSGMQDNMARLGLGSGSAKVFQPEVQLVKRNNGEVRQDSVVP